MGKERPLYIYSKAAWGDYIETQMFLMDVLRFDEMLRIPGETLAEVFPSGLAGWR
jgi:hypothetical protein